MNKWLVQLVQSFGTTIYLVSANTKKEAEEIVKSHNHELNEIRRKFTITALSLDEIQNIQTNIVQLFD